MSRDDVARAYPRPYSTDGTAEDGPDPGMSLRDHFAGQALAGQIFATAAMALGGMDVQENNEDKIAENSYKFADAMIRARNEE